MKIDVVYESKIGKIYTNEKNSKHFFNLRGKKYTREEKVRKISPLFGKIGLKKLPRECVHEHAQTRRFVTDTEILNVRNNH